MINGKMISGELAFGALGIIVGLHLIYITTRIMANLENCSDIRLALSMPHKDVQRSLTSLSASFLALGIGMGIAGIGVFYDHPRLDLYSRIGSVVGVIGLNYFLITFERITCPDGK